ncbi:hypothetical protein Ancab_014760 [Ancistrocladus abbreviatus]
MVRQAKPRKTVAANNVGKGKVTPVQVAFIVDRYLADNNYSETRSTFRTEASSLIAKSTAQEAPKSLLSLGAMLDEYISLKEQKVLLDQEKCQLEQEKYRIQTLLQGMQEAMNSYNSGASCSVTPSPTIVSSVTAKPMVISPAGYPPYKASLTTSLCKPANFSTPIPNYPPPRKRKSCKIVSDAAKASKKSCNLLPSSGNHLTDKGSDLVPQSDNVANAPDSVLQSFVRQTSQQNRAHGSSVQGLSIAKSLFGQSSQSPPSNSSGPKTPPRASSSQSDKSISPLEDISSTAKSNHTKSSREMMTPNCTIISSKTIIVSPCKQNSYCSIERSHCTFSSPVKRQTKRDHIKGRLDFDGPEVPICSENASGDGSTASGSDNEGDIFDFDLPNLDAFGPDFSLAELLTDFDIDCGQIDYTCPATVDASPDAVPV